jgi:hypothetical protein
MRGLNTLILVFALGVLTCAFGCAKHVTETTTSILKEMDYEAPAGSNASTVGRFLDHHGFDYDKRALVTNHNNPWVLLALLPHVEENWPIVKSIQLRCEMTQTGTLRSCVAKEALTGP